MLFNSVEFLIFFPIVTLITLLIGGRFRWVFLLAASYFFYMSWRVEYIVLILLSTVVDYWVTGQMVKTDDPRRRKRYLGLSLFVNLGLLFYFKYLIFFADSANSFFEIIMVDGRINTPALLLPVGISFYTFQTLSYTIDIYRGNVERENNFIVFALFVSYFPQLVAGPIERSGKLLPQLRNLPAANLWDPVRIGEGLRLITWGMFKKVVVADRLALYVNPIYNNPGDYNGISIALATAFFAFQIYCDFSGYSDIAIGSAKILGVDLSLNFRQPYFARSIPEFWQRWHISLSTWFRDYLYIPLGGNRVSEPRWMFNIFMVFFISGLWHGAAWTFALWGTIHGVFYLLYHYGAKLLGGIKLKARLLRWAVSLVQMGVLFAVVCLGWVFFRANSISDAFLLLRNMVTLEGNWTGIFVVSSQAFTLTSILGIGVVLFVDAYLEWSPEPLARAGRVALVRYAAYSLLLIGITAFGAYELNQQFVYFQF